MDALQDVINKLTYLKRDGKLELMIDSLNDNRDRIEDLNLMQLNDGMRDDGSSLPNYSAVSVAVFGKPAGPIRLYDTGAFYQGFAIDSIDDEGFVIVSRDSKASELISRYGINIFGLTEESEEIASEWLKPSVIEHLIEYLEL